jgi:hypothetical protein
MKLKAFLNTHAGVGLNPPTHCLEIMLGAAGFISHGAALPAGYSGYYLEH